jgi:hypothetical protein
MGCSKLKKRMSAVIKDIVLLLKIK